LNEPKLLDKYLTVWVYFISARNATISRNYWKNPFIVV